MKQCDRYARTYISWWSRTEANFFPCRCLPITSLRPTSGRLWCLLYENAPVISVGVVYLDGKNTHIFTAPGKGTGSENLCALGKGPQILNGNEMIISSCCHKNGLSLNDSGRVFPRFLHIDLSCVRFIFSRTSLSTY